MPKAKQKTETPAETEINTAEDQQETALTETTEDNKFLALLDSISEEYRQKIEDIQSRVTEKKRGLHRSTDDSGGVRPKILKINQPSTSTAPDSLKKGQLFTTLNEPIGDSINIAPMSCWTERVKWEEGVDVSDTPECKSTDGLFGFFQKKEWRECRTCPYRQWDPNGGPRGTGGFPCKESLNVMGINEELTDFYRIQFSGASAKIGKRFYNALKSRREIFDAFWTIKAQKQEGNANFQYAMPQVASEVEDGTDMFKVCDFLIDLIEETREKALERQNAAMSNAAALASGSGVITDGSDEDSGDVEDYNM